MYPFNPLPSVLHKLKVMWVMFSYPLVFQLFSLRLLTWVLFKIRPWVQNHNGVSVIDFL